MKQVYCIRSLTGIYGSQRFETYEEAAAKARYYTNLSHIPWKVVFVWVKAV